jgi:hypothetical protein
MRGTFEKKDLTPAELLEHMGGGAELDELRHELEQPGDPAAVVDLKPPSAEASAAESSAG